jgi:hypothetical protein
MILDNLQVSAQGHDFLAARRRDPELRSHTKVLSMAASMNCEALRRVYGDEIDAHLVLPFTMDALCSAVESPSARP